MEYIPRKYTLAEMYLAFYRAFRNLKYYKRAVKNNCLDKKFAERIMLAVTEVNGCELCSYAHTRMALEAGMDEEEIRELLAGASRSIPDGEATAILFAQHYADTKGNPSDEARGRLIDAYGRPAADGILGVTCMIMMGNVAGIPLSSFINRLKGKPVKGGNIFLELLTLIIIPVFSLLAFAHAMSVNLFSR